MLLSISQDKSIKLHQFPIFWPSEIIRKQKSKNQKSLFNINDKESKSSELIQNSNDDENTNNSDIYRDGTQSKLSIKRPKANLTESESKCHDLDGWDNEY